MAEPPKNGVWKAVFLTEVDFRDFNQKSLKVHRLFSGGIKSKSLLLNNLYRSRD